MTIESIPNHEQFIIDNYQTGNESQSSVKLIKGSEISAYDKNGVKLFTSEIGINGSLPNEHPSQWVEIVKRNSILTIEDSNSSLKFLSSNLGICAGVKNGQHLCLEIEANLNVIETEVGPFDFRLGLSFDSGSSIKDNSFNLNAAGLGISVGRKLSIKTPFLSIGVDLYK